MERELKKRGVTVVTGTTVERIERPSESLTLSLKDGSSITTEKLLVSVGRWFNSKGIGMGQVGVTVGGRGDVPVDEHMRTNAPNIYAIGDVTGKAMLAHVASAQGQVAVEHIQGHPRAINYDAVPAGIFTFPEIGCVGLMEQQARAHAEKNGKDPNQAVKVGRFPYAALGKAQQLAIPRGSAK